MKADRVEWHLWNWEQWQLRDSSEGDYESRASGGMGGTFSREFDAMVAECDTRCALAVDTIIGDLPSAQRIAVHAKHLGVKWPDVYRTRVDPIVAYADACVRIGRELDAKGIF